MSSQAQPFPRWPIVMISKILVKFSYKHPKLIPIDDDENIGKDVCSNTEELGKRGFCKSVIFTVLNVLVFKVTNWCKL